MPPMPPLAGKKLLICEEALIDQGGHYQTWIKAIRKMHLDAGAEVFVVGNREMVPEVESDLSAWPTYSVNSWNQAESQKWPAWRRYLHVFAQNWRVFWQTRAAILRVKQCDMVLFTSVRVHHLLGLRVLCAWGLGRRFRGLTCFLLMSQAEYRNNFTEMVFPARSWLLAWTLRSFRKLAASGRVILAGDSHVTCGEYEALSDVKMTLFPSPGNELRHTGGTRSREGLVFTMLGVSTWDKGIDVFHDAMELFLNRNPGSQARFVVQWSVPCVGPDGDTKVVSDYLRKHPSVTLLERRLSNEEYATLFGGSDFIVLPYRRSTYFNRISGVAVEAAVSGKPMIVTEGTWLEWAMTEFGSGLSIPENDLEALCAALERCCESQADFLAAAERRAEVALAYNSPDRYLGLLWCSVSVSVS